MRTFWQSFKILVFIGWGIAAIRLAMDAAVPETAMWVGIYYFMPLVFLFASLQGWYRGVPFKRLALGFLLVGILVWGPSNFIAYTLAQFQGWTHGRFAPGRGPEIGETPMAKLGTGAMIGAITALVGGVWCLLWGTILVWLPSLLLGKEPSAADESQEQPGNIES